MPLLKSLLFYTLITFVLLNVCCTPLITSTNSTLTNPPKSASIDQVEEKIEAPKIEQLTEKPSQKLTDKEDNNIYTIAEELPVFPGCENLTSENERRSCTEKALVQFIYQNLRYPVKARKKGIEGVVILTFVISKKGYVKDITIVQDIGAGCGDEVKRVASLMNYMPKQWRPGKQRGKKIFVKYTLPIRFKL